MTDMKCLPPALFIVTIQSGLPWQPG